MTAHLDYQWKLREMLAAHGMFSTTDLRPMLVERGIELSASQVYRLVVERPERLSLKVLVALVDILDCRMEELIEPVAAATGKTRSRKVVGGKSNAEPAASNLGQLRPKRARISGRRTSR